MFKGYYVQVRLEIPEGERTWFTYTWIPYSRNLPASLNINKRTWQIVEVYAGILVHENFWNTDPEKVLPPSKSDKQWFCQNRHSRNYQK